MSKRKNTFKKPGKDRAILFLIVLAILVATGMLGSVLELFVGLVIGTVGLFVGLTVGAIGLVFGLVGGIIGLIFGLLPIIIVIGILSILVKTFRSNPTSKSKRKNDDVFYV